MKFHPTLQIPKLINFLSQLYFSKIGKAHISWKMNISFPNHSFDLTFLPLQMS